MSAEDRRISALREYHSKRPAVTRGKLLEALRRMESGNTVVLNAAAKVNKTNLCLEAGISIHTLLAKDGATGKRKYADVIKRLEKLVTNKRGKNQPGDAKDEKIAELRAAYRAAVEDKVSMAREIDNLGMALLREKEEVVRLAALEAQNADLREEIRLMQASSKLRLVKKRGGKK